MENKKMSIEGNNNISANEMKGINELSNVSFSNTYISTVYPHLLCIILSLPLALANG